MGRRRIASAALTLTLALGLVIGLVGGLVTGLAGSASAAAPTSCDDLEIIAHRGFRPSGVDENTLGAYRAAADHGYSIETDVWHDRDGQLWMFHDRSALRATGVDEYIDEMSTRRVSQLRYRANGSPLTTFDQAWSFFEQHPSTRVYLEPKLRFPITAQVAERVDGSTRESTTWITAHLDNLDRDHPDVRLLVKATNATTPQSVRDEGADTVALSRRPLTPATVDQYRAAGVAVQSKLANETLGWRRTILAGAQGQLTDRPAALEAYCPGGLAPPRVKRFTPQRSSPGSTIVIKGRHFTDATRVKFGQRRARFDVVSARRIAALVPRNSPRRSRLLVKTRNGADRSGSRFVAR